MSARGPAAAPEEMHVLGMRPVTDRDYRLMVESISDYAIFLIDINGVIRSWNAGAQALKGYAAGEAIGRHFSMFYPQELIEKGWPQFELHEAGRIGRFEDEGWRLRKDGTRFWANIIITRLLDGEGRLSGFAKVTRDLSGRRSQEEMLRNSEERFRLLVESVQEYAIFMLDPAGHIISWNAGAEKNKGYKASEVMGKHFSLFYPEEVARSTFPATALASALREGQFQDEGWRVRKDGSRFWASVTITAVFDEKNRHRGFAKVTRDLTAARKIHHLEDESRRVTAYLAMLGHELRGPLAPMSNALALMKSIEIEHPLMRKSRDVLERQLAQMTRMVDDLLDVSRITSGKITLEQKPVELRDVIDQAIEAAQPLISLRQHALTVSCAPDVWVSGDRARLVQVVANLVNNAAKFTPEGGRLGIELCQIDGAAEIRVKDNGPGIAQEMQTVVFSLFGQVEQGLPRELGGLGIGLALSRQLVELHSGRLDLYSNGIPGEGCEFIVSIPTTRAPESLAPGRGSRRAVLVVDDNRDSADTLAMLIEGLGYSCRVAYDGPSAFDAILAQAPDLVFLDIGLPGLSGIEVARRIAAQVTSPPLLVAVTGYGQDEDREQTYKAGFQAHLTKPVDFNKIPALLKRMLQEVDG